MNITFLIGNGFDNSLGIDTSYESFYDWYCKKDSANKNIYKFKQHIAFKKSKYWSDFEEGLGNYTEFFTEETVEDFFECYFDAQKSLMNYINIQKKDFNFEGYNEQDFKKLSDGFLNLYAELNSMEREQLRLVFESERNSNTVFNFISFNYTDSLDFFVKELAKTALLVWTTNNGGKRSYSVNPNVLHVHGTMSKYPIIGVDNEEQIKNKGLLSVPFFKDLLIKTLSVNAIGEFWHKDAMDLIEKSRIICIWGMSLGSTDEKWWKKIVSWLSNSLTRHIIIYWHTDNPPNQINVLEYLRAIEDIKKRLTKYIDKDTTGIAKRMHIVINTKKVLSLPIRKKFDYTVTLPDIGKETLNV